MLYTSFLCFCAPDVLPKALGTHYRYFGGRWTMGIGEDNSAGADVNRCGRRQSILRQTTRYTLAFLRGEPRRLGHRGKWWEHSDPFSWANPMAECVGFSHAVMAPMSNMQQV
jgi:hypothetical protein